MAPGEQLHSCLDAVDPARWPWTRPHQGGAEAGSGREMVSSWDQGWFTLNTQINCLIFYPLGFSSPLSHFLSSWSELGQI